jgi:hypothetical protein
MRFKVEGWCDGGPWAGRQLSHYRTMVTVPLLRDPIPDPTAPDYMPNAKPTVQDGYYEFDDGAWRWRAPAE